MSFAAQLELGPLHEAEEATIMGSTHVANVELSLILSQKPGCLGKERKTEQNRCGLRELSQSLQARVTF